MLSRTQGIMFKAKQLLYLPKIIFFFFFLHIMLFLVYFNSFEVIRSQRLQVSKSYQNIQVRSIKNLLGVLDSFSLYYEIACSDL